MEQRSKRIALVTAIIMICVLISTVWMGKQSAAAHLISGAGASTLALTTQYGYSDSYYDNEDDGGSFPFAFIIAAGLAFIPATIAKNKGRSFGKWWFYGWMLFIVALIHSLLISPEQGPLDQSVSPDQVDLDKVD
jgi:hypothetical protein